MSFKQQLEILFENTDEKYLELANVYQNGDKSVEQELRKMVEKAAKASGYDQLFWRGGNFGTVWNPRHPEAFKNGAPFGLFFTESKEVAESYGSAKQYFIKATSPASFEEHRKAQAAADWARSSKTTYFNSYSRALKSAGFDSYAYRAWDAPSTLAPPSVGAKLPLNLVVLDSTQAKYADLITRTDKNNIIPLSNRFDNTNPDIRY